MKICKSNKFIFVVFEKKCLCSIFVLNAKSSIISRTFSTAFFFIKTEILNISLDLWLLFFAQTIKRQNLVDESMRDLKIWRNSIFFFVQLSSSFYSSFWNIFVMSALCASSIKLFACVALSIRRQRTFDFNATSISTRISLTTQLHRLFCECLIEWDLQKFSFIRRC
jgi:hypothetical protein